MHAITGLPTMETRRRILFARWVNKTRHLNETFPVYLAYNSYDKDSTKAIAPDQWGRNHKKMSTFTWERKEKELLVPRTAPIDAASAQRFTDNKAKEITSKDLSKALDYVKDSFPEGWTPKRLHQAIDDFESTRPGHIVLRWIVKRPTGKPPLCCKCNNDTTRATFDHIHECSGGTINGLLRKGLLPCASSAIATAYRLCLGWRPTWTPRLRRREPP